MSNDYINALGEWEGYKIGSVGRFSEGGHTKRPEIWIELFPNGSSGICSGCGKVVEHVHDYNERWIRDLPVFEYDTWLLVHRRRLSCPQCGPKLECLSWLGHYSRHTKRLAQNVARLASICSIKHVSEFYGLNHKTVKAIDKQHLHDTLGPIKLDNVTILTMDEFAIQKGHRYATVIIDPTCKKVLWIGRGRTREAIRPFFELLGSEGCKKIEAVAMDMNSSYEQEVWLHCPNAKIVYDLYHVIAKYGREVIDRVRVDQANKLRNDKKARKVIKSSRWLLLRNYNNIDKPSDQIRLKELLDANKPLSKVYIMKADLKHLWEFKYPKAAIRFWKQWYSRAMASKIAPLKSFARKLKPYIDGIISHCTYPLHTSLIEGINNKIKVIKRMAYGYRDDEYFFLKIRQAYPGNGN